MSEPDESDRALAQEALAAFGGERGAAAVSLGGAGARVTVLAPESGEALRAAAALRGMVAAAPAPGDAPADEAAWDRLGPAARNAQSLVRSGRIFAAIIALAGRGRIIGPVRPDLLLRHGISRWR